MTRIATSQLSGAGLQAVLDAQARQALAGKQLSSGKIASDLKGYAPQAATLTAAQTIDARVTGYLSTNTLISNRLAAQDGALNAVGDAADKAQQAVLSAYANGDGSTLLQRLQGWFSQASQALNTNDGAGYVFDGGAGAKPVDTSTLSTLTTGASASTHFTNGPLTTTDRLDETTTLKTGFTASQVGGPLFTALRNIQAYNDDPTTGPLTGQLTATQLTFLQSQLAPLQAATAGVRTLIAQNGENQSRVDAAKSVLTDRQTATQGVISGVTDADPAETATRVQLATVALQASAQVFQTLSGSSLLNLLRN